MTNSFCAAFKVFKGPNAPFLADQYAHAYGYLEHPAAGSAHVAQPFYDAHYAEFKGWWGFQSRVMTDPSTVTVTVTEYLF
jgi:hypothetical protein